MEEVVTVPGKREYVNVMETLVSQEVDRQIAELPTRTLRYIKRVEVETYALNRLPALYASSQKGWRYQYSQAQKKLQTQIARAVRQALSAVQVDPLRTSQPLAVATYDESDAALQALRSLFDKPDLTWTTALQRLKQLRHRQQGNATPAPDARTHRQKAWRPGTYGAEVAWKPKQLPAGDSIFHWDDDRYSKQ